MSIVAEIPGYFQVFSDGSVKRYSPPITDASPEFLNSYRSKDVIINPTQAVSARIFQPITESSASQLPLIVYFHGGGFCFGSTTWSVYHEFLGGLCVRAQSIVVSVDYRLAPEHRLPTAYDDCFGSLSWLSLSVCSEPWLERADLSRVFLSGESAGGNIVHHVALRAMRNRPHNVEIKGLLVIHPSFGSEMRIESEKTNGVVALNDVFWRLSLPEGSDRDHFACNFETVEMMLLPGIEWTRFPPTVVFLAGLDLLKERGVMYGEFLRRKGVEDVRLVVEERESHVYHILHPHSEATRLLQDQMTEFMTRFGETRGINDGK